MATEENDLTLLLPDGSIPNESNKQGDDDDVVERAGDVEEGKDALKSPPSSMKKSHWGKLKMVVKTNSILKLLPGMKMTAHKIQPDGSLVPCESTVALEASSESNTNENPGFYWIDIDSDDRDVDELRGFLEQLNISPFLASTLSKSTTTWASQVLPLPTSCLVLIRILPEDDATETKLHQGDRSARESAHIAALNMKNLLITLTSCKRQLMVGLDDEALEFMKIRERIPGASSSGALLLWLVFHVERTAKAVRDLRNRTMLMTELMEKDPKAVSLDDIRSTKEKLLEFMGVAEEQTATLQGLANVVDCDANVLDFAQVQGTLGILLATAGSTERMSLRLEKRIADLRQSYDSIQQDRINHRLAILTILSAIFLPLTFLAGVYGMNFVNIPELTYENGYFVLLGAMGLITAVMLCYFHATGWFE